MTKIFTRFGASALAFAFVVACSDDSASAPTVPESQDPLSGIDVNQVDTNSVDSLANYVISQIPTDENGNSAVETAKLDSLLADTTVSKAEILDSLKSVMEALSSSSAAAQLLNSSASVVLSSSSNGLLNSSASILVSSSSGTVLNTVSSSSTVTIVAPTTAMPNNGIPYLRITVADSAALGNTDENGEAIYSDAVIEIAGNGLYSDVPASAGKVRYRGNSTRIWYDKKPYRIKFSEKTEVLGLSANKDWVLLANARDQTKFMNAIVFDMARGMGNFKFVNANRFVEVEVNGDYKGIYQLTEQIEQAESRVNIDKTTGGVLFNMDKDDGPELNTWDNNNFWSSVYHLPMAVKYPKDVTSGDLTNYQADFAKVEQAIADSDYATFTSLMDEKTYIDYLIIQEITRNVEIEAPRSTYLYKDGADGKYYFGPIWDYDGGFGYSWNEETCEYFSSESWILSSGNPSKSTYNCTYANMSDWGCNTSSGNSGSSWGGPGGNMGNFGNMGGGSSWDGYGESGFFTNMFANAEFLAAYKARWNELKSVLYGYATDNLDGYVSQCKTALDNDAARWTPKRSYSTDIASLKTWLKNRIDSYTSVVEGY